MSRWKTIVLVPVLALLMAAAPLLVDPAPISVPAGLKEPAVARAITLGVAQRGWIVSKQEPGYMEATLNIRAHMARVGITYDTSTVEKLVKAVVTVEYAVTRK
jgi:hypothetical protein